jgi:hypothetical protein
MRMSRLGIGVIEAITMLTEREKNYTNLIYALSECGFLFSAKDFFENEELKQEDLKRTEGLLKKTEMWCKVASKLVIPVIETSLDTNISSKRFRTSSKIDFDFNSQGVHQSLSEIRSYVDLVCFRYCYSQPVVIAVVEADSLDNNYKKAIFEEFDQAMDSFREFTSSMKVGFGSVKMSVTGIILWSFFSTKPAQKFGIDIQNDLRRMHFWKKVNTLSWVVDLEQREIKKHEGLPLIVNSVFDVDRFKQCLLCKDSN